MNIGPHDTVTITAPTPTDEAKIIATGWPEIDPSDFRACMRLDGTVTSLRARKALISALLRVHGELSGWLSQRVINDETGTTIDFMTATAGDAQIDGKPAAQWHYINAVYCYAAASLNESMANFDATHQGIQRSDETLTSTLALQRDGLGHIRAIKGESSGHAELI